MFGTKKNAGMAFNDGGLQNMYMVRVLYMYSERGDSDPK